MKSMDKLTTGIAYGTSAGSAGYWFLQLLDKAPPPIAAATAFRNDGGIIHLSQPCAYLL